VLAENFWWELVALAGIHRPDYVLEGFNLPIPLVAAV
jgi:hypothetical protein